MSSSTTPVEGLNKSFAKLTTATTSKESSSASAPVAQQAPQANTQGGAAKGGKNSQGQKQAVANAVPQFKKLDRKKLPPGSVVIGWAAGKKEAPSSSKVGGANMNAAVTNVNANGQPKETKAEYAARKARQAADKLAFLERQAKREARAKYNAEQKAAYEERCARRAEMYEKQQAKAKRRWTQNCLTNRACFNCGIPGHAAADCPDPPYEGEY